MAALVNAVRSFLLIELGKGLFLTLKYFFKPKVTINYPYEKGSMLGVYGCRGLVIRGSEANMHCAVIQMVKNAALPASYAKRYAQHRQSPLRRSRVMMAAGEPQDMILI